MKKKTRKQLVKDLDKVFSLFIRQRDSKNGMFFCCSCGVPKPYEQADAGHFINRRFMATRWDESNVHGQCRSCNRFSEGNAAGYALFMIDKYGREHVEYLQALKNDGQKFTTSELELMIQDYKNRIK
jgi:hypothetical protein